MNMHNSTVQRLILHIWIALLVIALSVTACSSPSTPSANQRITQAPSFPLPAIPTPFPIYPKPGQYAISILSSQIERRFLVHIPEGYDHGVPCAIVLNFHGAGASVEQQKLLTTMTVHADKVGYIVVFPQAIGYPTYWDTNKPNSHDVFLQ